MTRRRRFELVAERHELHRLHERDVAAGLARVALPNALARKYPRAAQEFGWQFLFAARRCCLPFALASASGKKATV